MQKLDYQRALEGELERTISSLDPVASAKINLVIPDPNIYSSQEADPTASIVVQLKPDTDLTRGQIQAITHLVASSVEGLKPDNITLADTSGDVLSQPSNGDAATSSLQGDSTQLDVEHAYESDLERRLQAVLDQAIGPNQGIVRVSATRTGIRSRPAVRPTRRSPTIRASCAASRSMKKRPTPREMRREGCLGRTATACPSIRRARASQTATAAWSNGTSPPITSFQK